MSNENPNISGYPTIQQAVIDFLSDKGVLDTENYLRYFKWAARALTKLNMFDIATFETVYLTINDVGVAVLPEDYIDYTKIGIRDSKGQVLLLGINDDILINRATECGNPINDYYDTSSDSDILDGYYFVPFYDDDYGYTTLYGLTGGFAEGYYRIDRERRQIQFNSIIPQTTVILEYISSGIKTSGNTYVPRQAMEAVIAFMHWKDKTFNGGTLNQIEQAKSDWKTERQELRDFETIPTLQEIQDTFYSSYKQTPKR